MNSGLHSLPKAYLKLDRANCFEFKIGSLVLEPVIELSHVGSRFQAKLVAQRDDGVGLIPTLGAGYDWAYSEREIFPLPSDVWECVSRLPFADHLEDLSLRQALQLLRSPQTELRVVASAEFYAWEGSTVERQGAEILIPGLNATLYPYQSSGVVWMRNALKLTGGLILADEMGLGKTIQVISLFLLSHLTADRPALVVCPTTLLANWLRELTLFAPSLHATLHRGPGRARLHNQLLGSHVVITTYDTLVNDLVLFKAVEWSYLVCDEAQALKNPLTKRRMSISQIQSEFTIPVTGTPVETSLQDLWSLMDIAVPGLLGSQSDFESSYSDDVPSARALSRTSSALVLRRRVSEVADDLPERIDVPVPLELGESLAAEYEQVRLVAMEEYGRAGALVATGMLQIFCTDPQLVSRKALLVDERFQIDQEWGGRPTPKLERAIDLISEAFSNSRKVLLFCGFNGLAEILRRSAHGLPESFWGIINGSTPSEDRQPIVDAFSAYRGPAILVLNPKAAGSGLNITAATVVIHFTQSWNPATEMQASARAHRRGQTAPVTIYHLFYVETVEEVMVERMQRRREMGEEAVPSSEASSSDLARALQISPVHS